MDEPSTLGRAPHTLHMMRHPTAAGLPPGPRTHRLRHLQRFVTEPVELFTSLEREFGNIYSMPMTGLGTLIVLGEPEPIREVFSNSERFAAMSEEFVYFLNQPVLLFMSGESHKRTSKLMRPPFHGQRMSAYSDTIARVCHTHFERWDTTHPQAMLPAMKAITIDVLLECVFGLDAESSRDFKTAMLEWLSLCMNPLLFGGALLVGAPRMRALLNILVRRSDARLGHPMPRTRLPWSALAHRERALLEDLDARLEASRRLEPQDDILSLLVHARYEDGKPMSREHMLNTLIMLAVAGYETSATALSWAIYNLARTPATLGRCRDEVDALFGRGPLDASKVHDLTYTQAVVKEALRLHPISIGVGRRVTEPCQLSGYDIPAGAVVQPTTYLSHRNPKVWARPHDFWPERFLDQRPTFAEYFPFGGGPKICLGKAFALHEMTVVLAELVRTLDLTLMPGYDGRATPRGITLAPAKELPMRVTKREYTHRPA